MADRTQINIRVDTEQKESWESFIEDTEQYQTITSLVRSAVHAEMNGQAKNGDEPPPELVSGIQQVRERLEIIEGDIAWLRKREQKNASVEGLAQTVYSSLQVLPEPTESLEAPDEMEEEEYRNQVAAQLEIEPASESEFEEDGHSPQTKQAIADRVGAEPDRVQDAINHLQEQLLPVVAVEYDGQTHYFREE